jgi:hypothetical protein
VCVCVYVRERERERDCYLQFQLISKKSRFYLANGLLGADPSPWIGLGTCKGGLDMNFEVKQKRD